VVSDGDGSASGADLGRTRVFGSVAFYRRRLVTTSAVDPTTGKAEALLGTTAARQLSARYSGDAPLAPSRATGQRAG
jgi:hypothetical protein